jgi:large subunit ribosomal protein L7/L12
MSTNRWSAEIQALGDRIAGLTTTGAAELHKYLEVVHGIKSLATPVGDRLPPPPPPPPPPPTEFRVTLTGFDPARKVTAIKAVRELLSLGIREARDVVEGSGRVIKEGLTREEADKLKAHLEAAGAVVSVTGVVAEPV